jgi:hypothetical protein
MRGLLNRPAIEAAEQFRRIILDNPSLYLDDFSAMAEEMQNRMPSTMER